MNKVLKVFSEYKSNRSKMFDFFGTNGWENIEDQITTRWHLGEDNYLQFLDDSGTEYGFDSASKVGETVDGFELFYVRDNGHEFYALFSESFHYESCDDYEKEIGIEI